MATFFQSISTEPFMLIGSLIYSTHQITLTQLLIANGCKRQFNTSVCENLQHYAYFENKIQQDSALWMAAIQALSLSIGLFAVIIIGNLADTWKKTRLMLLQPIFAGLQSLIYFTISYTSVSFAPGYLLIGAFWSGIFGELQGIILLSVSFLAETTEESSRTLRFLFLEICVYIGFSVSGMASGYLIKATGYPPVFLLTLSLCIANFLYVRCYLWRKEPKIYKQEADKGLLTDQGEQQVTESTQLLDYKSPCVKHAEKYACTIFPTETRLKMAILFVAFIIALTSIVPEPVVQVFYFKRSPFTLSPIKVGIVVFVQNVLRGGSSALLNLVLIMRLGLADIWVVMLSYISFVLYFLTIGLSKNPQSVIPLQLLGIAIPLSPAGLRSMMTKLVDPSNHGKVLALAELLDGFAALVSIITMNVIYAESVSFDPAIAFYVFTSNGILGIILMLVYRFILK